MTLKPLNFSNSPRSAPNGITNSAGSVVCRSIYSRATKGGSLKSDNSLWSPANSAPPSFLIPHLPLCSRPERFRLRSGPWKDRRVGEKNHRTSMQLIDRPRAINLGWRRAISQGPRLYLRSTRKRITRLGRAPLQRVVGGLGGRAIDEVAMKPNKIATPRRTPGPRT